MNLCFQFDYSKSQSLTLLGFFFCHYTVILCAGEGKRYHIIALIFSFFITFVCLLFFLDLYASQPLSIFFLSSSTCQERNFYQYKKTLV